MVHNEGVRRLWRGSSLTINRAMIVTASQLATYDQAKEATIEYRGGRRVGPASFTGGIMAAAGSNPVDMIKTRMVNMKVEFLIYMHIS
jgi:solute carrier family 25 (mitochondrial oxoglutarate transporter), member 11